MSIGLKIVLVTALVLAGLVLLFSLAFVRRPIRSVLASGIQGVCALAAVNIAGAFTGVSLGVNLFSGAVCMILGVPGVVSMLIANLLFRL